MVQTTANVERDGVQSELDIRNIVLGDIIHLSAGDIIPAEAAKMSPLELKNLCFMGIDVISGTVMVVALNTGDSTYFGSLSKVAVERRAETGFDKGLKRVSYLLIVFMAVMVPIMLLVNGFVKHD
jgi:Mg2+-importing ATPase